MYLHNFGVTIEVGSFVKWSVSIVVDGIDVGSFFKQQL